MRALAVLEAASFSQLFLLVLLGGCAVFVSLDVALVALMPAVSIVAFFLGAVCHSGLLHSALGSRPVFCAKAGADRKISIAISFLMEASLKTMTANPQKFWLRLQTCNGRPPC
jgi:hypothetical protein